MGRNDTKRICAEKEITKKYTQMTIMRHNKDKIRAMLLLLVCIMTAGETYAYGYNKTAEEYDKELKALYQDNKMDSIRIILEEALRLYPNDTDMNRWAGTYHLQRRDTASARYHLIKAVQEDTDNFLAKNQLVALEEQLGNLSSAICYVNEMLELYPYDQTLWKKKIGLYRKQGNDIEADRLLKRMYSIYPNDSTVRSDYLNRMEETYIQQRKDGKRSEAIATLKQLIEHRDKDKTYYLDLGNLLYQEGHSEEAVAVLSKGLEHFPGDNDLLRKKAEIMAERGYSRDAVGLLQKSNSVSLYPVANELMVEAARSESWKDPYTLYGRIYDSRKSDEALDYLIRTSISREYYDDALFYLSEYRKRYGENTEILYKEYRIYKRTGDRKSAIRTLEKYLALNGTDKDMANEFVMLKTDIADELMKENMHQEAVPNLESALVFADEDTKGSVTNKLISCYLNTNKNVRTVSFIDSIRLADNNKALYSEQKAEALHNMNQSESAIAELEEAGMSSSETYERISSEYIKRLNEQGASEKAYAASRNWVEKTPQSQLGLMYAISTSDAMNKYDETDAYISRGKALYPEEPYFVIKEAAAMYRNNKYSTGMDTLRPWVESYPGNKELVSAYSAHADMRAQELLKENKPDEALNIVKHAMELDNTNQELLLTEGRAYEMKGDYKSAYNSYSRYSTEALWTKEYRRRLMNIQNKGYRNSISADVLTGWYADGNRPNTIISAAYTRRMKRDYITSTVNISSRNYKTDTGSVDYEGNSAADNTGAQLRLEWGHTFNSRWSSVLALAAANSIFPEWLGQAGVLYMFPKDVEIGVQLGYRKNYTPASIILDNEIKSGNMYNLRLSNGIYRELWRVNTNLDAFMLNKSMYFNINSKFRYYPAYDNNTHIMVSAGVGTAPEIDFVDRLMPGSFENINVSLGIGGAYMVSKNISLGLTASYHYFYNQSESTDIDDSNITTNHKNLYEIYANIIFSF